MRIWFVLFLICVKGAAGEVAFEKARPDQQQFLTELGMRSNAVYGYRTVSEKKIRAVFQVKGWHIKEGNVRLMKSEGKIIGFFGLLRGKKANMLSHLFLEPEYIGKGYGKILFLEAIRVAKEELKWETLQWESEPHAAWFYQKMGAIQIGEKKCPLNPRYQSPIFLYRL